MNRMGLLFHSALLAWQVQTANPCNDHQLFLAHPKQFKIACAWPAIARSRNKPHRCYSNLLGMNMHQAYMGSQQRVGRARGRGSQHGMATPMPRRAVSRLPSGHHFQRHFEHLQISSAHSSMLVGLRPLDLTCRPPPVKFINRTRVFVRGMRILRNRIQLDL